MSKQSKIIFGYHFINQFVERAASHSVVGGALATLRRHPVDVLSWILYVARLIVDAVLSVDLQPFPLLPLNLLFHVLVHTCTGMETPIETSILTVI